MNQRLSYRTIPMSLVIALVVCAAPVAAAGSYRAQPRSRTSGRTRPSSVANGQRSNPSTAARPQQVRPVKVLFTRETSFGEAIDLLRRATTPPLNIVVLWNQIGDNAGIYRDTPIGVDLYSGLKVRQYLDIILKGVSAGATDQLGYAVSNGVVLVATVDALPNKRVTRVYDVTDLLAPPANYRYPMMGFGGMGGPMMGGMGGPMMGGMGGYGQQMMGGPGGFGGGYGGGFGGYGPGMGMMPGGGFGGGYGGGFPGIGGSLYGGGGYRR
jgi:hypothetical protein